MESDNLAPVADMSYAPFTTKRELCGFVESLVASGDRAGLQAFFVRLDQTNCSTWIDGDRFVSPRRGL